MYQTFMPGGMHDALIEPLLRSLPYRFHRVKTAAVSLGQRNFVDRMIRWFGGLSAREQQAMTTVRRCPYRIASDDPRNSALRRILSFDQSVWLPDNLLERDDRMTMGASLESRMPFLDQDLVAFASSLPDNYRLRRPTGKWILRRVAEEFLPPSIIQRPKSGFRMPVNEWLRNEMRPFLTDILGASALSRPFYRARRMEAALEEHLEGKQNHEKLLWQMLALEVFMREYQPSI
jgi:asparagine synthase (glutamine-hydrolysing)